MLLSFVYFFIISSCIFLILSRRDLFNVYNLEIFDAGGGSIDVASFIDRLLITTLLEALCPCLSLLFRGLEGLRIFLPVTLLRRWSKSFWLNVNGADCFAWGSAIVTLQPCSDLKNKELKCITGSSRFVKMNSIYAEYIFFWMKQNLTKFL